MPINIQLASCRQRLPVGSYSVGLLTAGNFSGTGFSANGSIDLYFQAQNRAGFNLQTDKTTVDYLAGGAIVVTFFANAIAPGEDVFALVISGDTTGNPQNAVQLACWSAREFDQVSLRSLPVDIVLSDDRHLIIEKNVQSVADLPGDDALINGAIATVVDDSETYVYNEDAPDGVYGAVGKSGYWLVYAFDYHTYIEDTSQQNGTNTPLDEIVSQLPGLPKIKGADSTPIRYWVSNDYPESNGPSILPGAKYQLEFKVNGVLDYDSRRSYNSIFAGAISFTFIGLVRLLTGVLYTDVTGAGTTAKWNPGKGQILETRQEVLAGYAAVWDIWFNTSSDNLVDSGLIRPGQDIRLNDIYEIRTRGEQSDLWYIVGDAILPQLQKLRVVPNEVLPGHALIQGYRIDSYYSQPIAGLLEDTSGQIIAVSAARDGDVSVRQDLSELDETEVQRALVSTASGFTNPSSFSDPVQLAAGESLYITIGLPLTTNLRGIIRANYPDSRLTGLEATWNTPKIRVYLQQDSTLYYKETLIDSGTQAQQVITITDLNDFAQIPLIPSQSDEYFGLFGYGSLSLGTGTDSSTLTAGEYKVAIAWVYPGPNVEITSIDHSEVNGSIAERSTIFDSTVSYWNAPLMSVEEARELRGESLQPGMVWKVNSSKKYVPYVFDPDVIDSDNGLSVIKPTVLTNTTGALVPLRTLGQRVVSSNGLLPARHNLRFQGSVTVADDAANDTTVVIIPDVNTSVPQLPTILTWPDGQAVSYNEELLLNFFEH